MSTYLGPVVDPRVGDLRSIANAIEVAFPDNATDLRNIAASYEREGSR